MERTITDSKGRKLGVKDLNVMDQVRLLRAIGAGQSTNQPYVQIVTMAAGVVSIDGTPFIFPTNERQIDAAIARLGDEGVAALLVDMQRQINDVMKAAEEAGDGEAAPSDPLARPSA